MKVMGFEGSRKGVEMTEPKSIGIIGNVEQKQNEF